MNSDETAQANLTKTNTANAELLTNTKRAIISQTLFIRDTGLTNMLDTARVLELAKDFGFSELANFLSEEKNRKKYWRFIIEGKI